MKNWIFIEAKDTRTPEAQFLTAVLSKYFPEIKYEFIPMDGADNLKQDAIITQIQQHSTIFDCFEDYEACVSGKKDEKGEPVYNTPNRKGKLHTYITAIKLNKKKRDKLGSGQWLFDDPDLWDLTRPDLQALRDFFDKNMK